MNTSNEQAAERAGYPVTLFGYTPNDKPYWSEPGLPWIVKAARRKGWHIIELGTDEMAPRFPRGAAVAVAPVQAGEQLAPGVYVWPAANAWHIGRLSEAPSEQATCLLLSQDNSETGITCLLEWERPGFALYRVTHYESIPTR